MNNNFIIGLDIGIASVGWAVLRPNQATEQGRIIDLGVRCFDKAEQPKTGEPLNLARRLQRNTRTRLAHRVQRLKKLRRYLKLQGLISSADENALITPANSPDPWQLRVKALDQLLTGEELARAIYHLVKHRGYYVGRKAEELADEKSDQGRMSKAVKETKGLFESKNYRTVAEMVLKEETFKEAKRNKAGDYKHTFYRSLLRDELNLLLNKQRELGSSFITDEFIAEVDNIFWYQRPALSGEAILKMLGFCTHEKKEYRAAKACYSAERYIWLSSLNNLRIRDQGEIRPLTEQERAVLVDLPFYQQKITYKTLRKELKKHCDFAPTSYFTGIGGRTEDELDKAENKTFFHSKAYHELKKAFTDGRWLEVSKDMALLDEIATILSLYKTDDEINQKLAMLSLSEDEIKKLLLINFSQFINLSLVALQKLLPHLEAGKNYYEACELCGYHSKKDQQKVKYLPSLYDFQFDPKSKQHKRIPVIKNPVVMRALNQSRKVVNELIRKYGSPSEVHIELARDLSKPFEERTRIQKEQDKFRLEKEKIVEYFNDLFVGRNPRGAELLKFRLYREQSGKDAYTLETIDLDRLCEDGYMQIDHILPYSRSYDDSLSNKVLVLNKTNQDKTNQTPYEYLRGEQDTQQWRDFEIWVSNNKNYSRPKKERLLKKNFDEKTEKEWASRNLNDTRYIARFFSQFVKDNLLFANDKGRVVVPSGNITSTLRKAWGLIKRREQSDLHHALDACVVAAANHKLIMDINVLNKKDYLKERDNFERVDKNTGEIKQLFPEPWPTFRKEVEARINANPKQSILDYKLPNYSPEDIDKLKPIFVSRMPKRRNSGALHQETIRSAKYLDKQLSTIRKPLTSLKLTDLDKIVGCFMDDGETPDPRNTPLINALQKRLEQYNNDGKKAFAEPFYKPSKKGELTQLVKNVKLFDVQKGGVKVRDGVANQDSMWRVDVFEKEGKYYLVPLYQIDRSPNQPLPNRAATAGKSRDQWVEIDENYQFKFSLMINDGVYLKTKKETYLGYFAGLDIATAAINIRSHDNNEKVGKKGSEGVWRSIGLKLGIEKFEKLQVDVLGNYYPVKQEKRYGMA
ncbi:type II CRISPR RNA-guided endonuclease Cas9 [Entomomonas asaccharolytica]|uniref:CRISPR-associated endonuclease Cas9 n=1 Tax=Entomomonas asaccharolytica TaxID=2785331 RepID=A0A974NH50_9GAMM|nr:type II CRISPR RNA-guided endonuclease Cas9 [Entomomonas asaccharolytica]QQP86485.1 type II CRISPR RNA-guided endonuclease Cas9 [Entomomonas asaccharolytica]